MLYYLTKKLIINAIIFAELFNLFYAVRVHFYFCLVDINSLNIFLKLNRTMYLNLLVCPNDSC